ncbi:MAG: MATE family efflux transporter [Candidatus Alcyoniella australis]|nr:MATE family efflux transporter [Candidatus Alcyoniella australis]
MALPTIGAYYLQAAYNFIDRYWVGHLPDGPAAFAGVSAGMFIIWGTFALTNLATIGTSTMVSRALGAEDQGRARHAAGQGLVLALLLSVISAGVLLPQVEGLFHLMGTTAAVTADGASYVRVLLWGQPLLFLSFVLNSVYQASGDTVTPIKFVAFSLVVNSVLDPLLIYGYWGFPAMGVAGAAWATLCSRGIWVAGGLYLLLRGHKNLHLRLSDLTPIAPRIWFQALRIGLPQCLSNLLFAAVYIALTTLTSRVGTAAVAGLGIGHTVEQLTFFGAMGFSIAASTMVGQNLGAGQPQRAARAVWSAAGIAAGYNTLFGLAFLLIPGLIVRIFVNDPEVVRISSSYLVILAISQPFMALELVLAGGFNGAGNTLPPTAVQIPLTLARFPIALALMHIGLGADGIWWAISLTTIVKALCIAFLFSLGRWKHKQV